MGISIWEGNKAQELIDAIASNEKINKQQGTGNSGKVLVVGRDGKVVPTYNILPDAVKNALMDCFTHVLWDSDQGESTYGAALREALYNTSPTGAGGLVYAIPSDISLALLSTSTGITVFDVNNDEEFTILIKGTWKKEIRYDENGSNIGGSYLLDGRSQSNTIMSRIQTNIDNTNGTVAFRSTHCNVGGNTNAHSADSEYEVVFVQRYSSGIFTIKTFVDGVLEYNYNGSVVTTMVPGSYYTIGNNHTGVAAWTGTCEVFNIYNVALSDSEIESILGISM